MWAAKKWESLTSPTDQFHKNAVYWAHSISNASFFMPGCHSVVLTILSLNYLFPCNYAIFLMQYAMNCSVFVAPCHDIHVCIIIQFWLSLQKHWIMLLSMMFLSGSPLNVDSGKIQTLCPSHIRIILVGPL